ncbi:MAG: AAA family ATPase [bacterium]
MTTPEITPQFQAALDLMEDSNQHVFLTGRAGTGKSTLLNHFRTITKKKVAVLAPTGVAAINVGGQTIHSFFRFRPDVTPDTASRSRPAAENAKLYKTLDTIVIDEVSMLRADMLDCINRFLRLYGPHKDRPFGGVQMIFIGDLYQLPPVVTTQDREIFNSQYKSPYFFDAKIIDDITLYLAELDHIFRQKDDSFISILNAIRENAVTPEQLEELNERQVLYQGQEEGLISLTTTNDLAHKINDEHLRELPAPEHTFVGTPTGSFKERDFPTPQELKLKPDAQVMLLVNDPKGRWVNGSIGRVKRVYDDPQGSDPVVEVELSDGRLIKVLPFMWEMSKYVLSPESGQLESELVGSYRHYPLRLAWAVTIHKSQGSTFDRVHIDLGRGTFSHGQLYVALSRCRTLDGITLKQSIVPRYIVTDKRISEFLKSFKDGMRQVGQASLAFGDGWSEWGA